MLYRTGQIVGGGGGGGGAAAAVIIVVLPMADGGEVWLIDNGVRDFTAPVHLGLIKRALCVLVEKLPHHCSGIPVEFDGILEHLSVGIEFRAT